MQLALTVPAEETRIEQRGGHELLSHFLGAKARTKYRREAIDRALRLYEKAFEEESDSPRLTGLGLLVLQRALLPVEDLGRLIYALQGDQPWRRLLEAKIPDIDAALTRASSDPDDAVQKAFGLATVDRIREQVANDLAAEGLIRLRELATRRWTDALRRATGLWLGRQRLAKATMHGFPLVAGAYVIGPPPAGEMADGVNPPNEPFALAIGSTVRDTHVRTERYIVPLGPQTVRSYRSLGRGAARLVEELCLINAESIQHGHDWSVPLGLIHRLPDDQQAAVRAVIEATSDESDDD